MNKQLNFEEVPHWWAICVDNSCPLCENCLRHHAARVAPVTATKHLCIIPHPADDGRCPHFVEDGTLRLARGFTGIFSRVSREHHTAMKRQLMAYLGTATSKGTYYRYAHGERLLTPEQQAWIGRMMACYGYSPDVTFDDYVDDFIFKAGTHYPASPTAGLCVPAVGTERPDAGLSERKV